MGQPGSVRKAVVTSVSSPSFQELSKITMPIAFNEPLSFLQRITEYMEHVYLIHRASCQPQPLERMQSQALGICEKGMHSSPQCSVPFCLAAVSTALFLIEAVPASPVDYLQSVAAFAVSAVASQWERTGKPFNPLLGETYELIRAGKSKGRNDSKEGFHSGGHICHHTASLEFQEWSDGAGQGKVHQTSRNFFLRNSPPGSVAPQLPSCPCWPSAHRPETDPKSQYSGPRGPARPQITLFVAGPLEGLRVLFTHVVDLGTAVVIHRIILENSAQVTVPTQTNK
ncbi:hypothetical protein P7K49_010033 [Saguinus oedipus]|uniref:Uncharacterized protein n=1 Tax=Saguinus oedipus TaxID=9490 RepID=A0ABQ9VPW1_SAGOE|nr:hypothetical protein P7K49_010033 [Saguinus oedipus]